MVTKMNKIERILTPVVLLLLIPCPVVLASSLELAGKNIKYAETYFQFGIEDKGNARDYQKGLSYLEEARKLLASLPQTDEKKILEKRVADLKSGIEQQEKKARYTLYGMFPLVRFLVPTLFVDPGSVGMYELVKDPETTAVENALKKLLTEIKTTSRVIVEIKTIPQNRKLEIEAEVLINSLENFVLGKYQEGIDFLSVTIEEDRIDKEHLYRVMGMLTDKKKEIRQVYINTYFRDRRDILGLLVLTNVILFILAVFLFFGIRLIKVRKFPPITSTILFPIIGFLLGRILPWILVPLISTIKPFPGAPAILSFWWPLLAGVVLLAGASLVFYGQIRIYAGKFGLQKFKEDQGLMFIFISLGVSAYLAGPLFIYSGGSEWEKLLPLILGSGSISYLLGCALDREHRMPWKMAFIAAILASVLGTAVFSFHLGFIIIVSTISILLSILAGLFCKNPACNLPDGGTSPHPPEEIPKTVNELIERARNPFFVQWDLLNKAYNKVFQEFGKKTIALGLVGKWGTGKTVVVEEIISKLKAVGKPVDVIEIKCPADDSQLIPCEPWRKALVTCTEKNRFLASVDATLKTLFDQLIPFFRRISPGTDEPIPTSLGQSELKILAIQLFQQLIKKKSLIVSIDNFHCIDNESQKIVESLFKEFPIGGDAPILLILTGKDEQKLKSFFKNNCIPEDYLFPLDPLEDESRIQMLNVNLGLNKGVCREIINNIGRLGEVQKNIRWLFLAVIYLAQFGAFLFKKNEFNWNPDFKAAYNLRLPIPKELKELLRKNLKHATQYYELLVCAACIGMEFDLEILACSLGMPRFEVLKKITLMESETRIIEDIQEGKHTFRFTSQYLYDIVRAEFKVTESGPGEKMPEIIREFHYRIASCIENTPKALSLDIIGIADHYYAAGISHAGKVVEWCSRAARECCRWYRFEQAYQFLKKAREYNEYLEQKRSFIEDELMIKLDEAYIRGKQRKIVTDEALNYIKVNEKASIMLLLLVIRACHSMGKSEKTYFKEAIAWANIVIKRTQAPEEKAEAYLYIGLCLDFFKNQKERRENLRKVEELLKPISPKSTAVELLLARCCDSLANDLTCTGDNKDKVMALGLFRNSIKIKKSKQTYDLAGLARSYGGLGRLFLEWNRDKKDIDRAKIYFEEDLKLSIQLNDLVGQIKMHSFLGQCCIETREFQEAEEHYNKSLELCWQDQYFRADQFFALLGLLKVYALTGEKEKMTQIGSDFLNLVKSRFDTPEHDIVNRFIDQFQNQLGNYKWFEELNTEVKKMS